MNSEKIKVLIVEDSPLAARLLSAIIGTDPSLKVIGCVESGELALEFIKTAKPDVITMDIILPKMDGFETTRQIMQKRPTPIIIVSATYHKKDVEKSFKAISVGALDILEKPAGPHDPAFQTQAESLLHSIRNAAKIKMEVKEPSQKSKKEKISLVHTYAIAMGASLGGPKALNTLFSQIPSTFPLPIFLVQHISEGFTNGLVDWLQSNSDLTIQLANHHEIAKGGHVYVAPENFHLEVEPNHKIHLSRGSPKEGLCLHRL